MFLHVMNVSADVIHYVMSNVGGTSIEENGLFICEQRTNLVKEAQKIILHLVASSSIYQ